MENYEKSVPLLNALYKEINVPTLPTSKLVKKTIGTRTILEVTSDVAGAAGADDPQAKVILEAMFGKDGKMTFSQTVLDDKTVITAFTSAEGLAQLLQGLDRGSLKNDPEVARVLRTLPQGSQWIVLVNPHGVMEMVRGIAKAVVPVGGPNIPEFPRTPPVGAGAMLSESGLILKIVVPVEVFDAIGRLPRDVSDR
jgi:hypothetical protein